MGLAFVQYNKARKFNVPPITKDLAEDFGIQIGDGYIKGQNSRYTILVSGHITEDKHYLVNYVKPLKEKLYNVSVKVYRAPLAGTLVLKIDNKELFKFYIEKGLKESPKINIKIPNFITENKKLQIACLRGLMDTDGSLCFNKGDHKTYSNPVLHFSTKSKVLARQVCKILDNFEFSYYVQFDRRFFDKRTKKYYVENDIYVQGKKSIENWVKIVGSHNISQFSRYLVYKKLGFCPPHTTLAERLKILKW